MPAIVAPLRIAVGFAGPAFRVGKMSWDNRQSRGELEGILRGALARAISPEHAGRSEVQEAAARLADRFRFASPPETSPGFFGRIAAWGQSRIPFLPPLMANQEPIDEAGWYQEQRRWAENALDDPDVERELRLVSRTIGRVEVGQVMARFPDAYDHVLRHGEPNKTRTMLLKLRASGEWAREQLDLKPRPPVVAGTSVLAGAGSIAGGYLVGLDVGVAVAIGLGIALVAGFAVALAARFPVRHDAALVVRMAAVHWVVDLFDAIGPGDLRGTTPDTVEGDLRAAMAREPSRTTLTGAKDVGGVELKHVLGELVEDLSSRVIRRAETVGDGPLVAALYAVEDHGKRVQRKPDPATLAALYSAMLDMVVVCLPPLPPSALSPAGREIVQVLSLLTSQVVLVPRAESQAGDGAQDEPELSSAVQHGVATTAPGGVAGMVGSTKAVQLVASLTPDGRWGLPSVRRGAALKPPAKLTDRNWRRNRAFPGSTLNELHRTDPSGGDARRCIVAGKVHGSDPPRWLHAELHRDGRGVVKVGGLCEQDAVDVELLAVELVAAMQVLVLHANHRAMKKGHADLEVRLLEEPNGNGTQRPIQLRVGPGGPVTGLSVRDAAASASIRVNAKATGKSITTQLVASSALLVKLLAGFEVGDPGLITEKGTPVAAAWSERRRSAMEEWAERHKIAWAV